MDFEKLKIFEGQYWDIFLHQDQTVPGRLYFWYRGEEKDLLDVSREALLEFYELGKRIKDSLTENFQPDLFNYLSLNNRTSHLHIHLIPRYKRKIQMFGLTFEDLAFGESYKRNEDFAVEEDILIKIKDLIKEKIK